MAETGVCGAGDCEREGVLVALLGGGPRAQADFDGSWGGFFDVETVADLLILWSGSEFLYVRESSARGR